MLDEKHGGGHARRVSSISVLSLALVYSVPPVFALESLARLDINITQSSIEDLLSIKLTTASRKPQSFSQTPAAVYVLTTDDIRRSGATSIPEVLRLVTGVQVVRVDANKWGVSIRGFNARAANKLLVLIDGRSIYDPLFRGVIWEAKHVMPEDITAFVNQYKSLFTTEGLTFGNKSSGKTHGVEASVTYIPADNWKWVAAYSYLRLALFISDNLQFSLVGQNQLESHHAEQSTATLTSEVEDGRYAKLQYVF